jgi:hypothetical protein
MCGKTLDATLDTFAPKHLSEATSSVCGRASAKEDFQDFLVARVP